MRRLYGVIKPRKQPSNIGNKPNNRPSTTDKKRLDMPRATGNGFHLTGVEYDRHLEVIMNKLSETPPAVDAILFVLNKIVDNPKNLSNRQINTTKPVFARTIGKNLTWSERLLEAIGFTKTPNGFYHNLTERNFRLTKLKLAIDKLEKAQESATYLLSQDKINFSKETMSLLQDGSESENISKTVFMGKVPATPRKGAGGNTNMRVYFGEADIQRFFASDNTLQCVLDWICASLHSTLLERLRSGDFELINRTTYPPKKMNITPLTKENRSESSGFDLLALLEDDTAQLRTEEKTLQELGLWPSGEVEIQKTGFLERERALKGIIS